MKNLVIYDNNGVIFFQASGSITTPEGLQHMYVDIPEGKTLQSVDVSSIPHHPIFLELPKTEIQQELELLKILVAELGLQIGGDL